MCGKFTQRFAWQGMHAELAALAAAPGDTLVSVTPMRFAQIIRLNEEGVRDMAQMRWGFSKISATAPGAKPDHIHARAETVDVKPTFRDAFEKRRGLVLVHSFNEGRELASGKTEQHIITPNNGDPIAIAVLWEGWEHEDGSTLLTFVMVTTPPNPLIATITDRMPAIIKPEDWSTWLGENGATPAEAKALLQTVDGGWSMRPEKESRQPSLF